MNILDSGRRHDKMHDLVEEIELVEGFLPGHSSGLESLQDVEQQLKVGQWNLGLKNPDCSVHHGHLNTMFVVVQVPGRRLYETIPGVAHGGGKGDVVHSGACECECV